MTATNGIHPEAHPMPLSAQEWEWETPEHAQPEWETPAQGEWEWETQAHTQGEWETPAQGEWETFEHAPEWEMLEQPVAQNEAEWEAQEADPFFPLLALAAKPLLGLAAKAGAKMLPKLAGKVIPRLAQRILPRAARAAGQVARRVLGNAARRIPRAIRALRPRLPNGRFAPTRRGLDTVRPRPTTGAMHRPAQRPTTGAARHAPQRPGRPATPGTPAAQNGQSAGGSAGSAANPTTRDAQIAALLRQLADVFAAGEQETAEFEAHVFGPSAAEGELASTEAAHEAALTEVLAAEATHAPLAEATALLGAALPVTVRMFGGRSLLRPVMPTLVRANGQLVTQIHQLGPNERELLRLVPAVQRRTIASLRVISRSGQRLTPNLVAQVMAGHVARVFGTPRIAGPAMLRNISIRQGTVGPAQAA